MTEDSKKPKKAKKRRSPASTSSIKGANERRLRGRFDVEFLDSNAAPIRGIRHSDYPLNYVDQSQINKLIVTEAGTSIKIATDRGETLKVTYVGEISEDALAISLGYVYMTQGLDVNAPSAPVRSIVDLVDLLEETVSTRAKVLIMNNEKATEELAAFTKGKPMPNRFIVCCQSDDPHLVHVTKTAAGSGCLSLCGFECIANGAPVSVWRAPQLSKRWCDVCHAIAIELEKRG